MPVALNLYEIRKAKGTAGDFFHGVQKQRPEAYQGLFLVSPAGKVLSGVHGQKEGKAWTKDVLAALDDGLGKFGEVSPRRPPAHDPFPFRGVGKREDGGIQLAVYLRPMVLGLDKRGFGDLAVDSISLSPGQLRNLEPPDTEEGTTWEVSSAVVRRLHRLLSPSSDANTLARADEVTRASLAGKVERVRGGVAYLSYKGAIAGVHVWPFEPHKGKKMQAQMTLTAVATCDAKTGKMLSFTLVGEGTHRSYPPYDSPSRYGAVAEWRRRR